MFYKGLNLCVQINNLFEYLCVNAMVGLDLSKMMKNYKASVSLYPNGTHVGGACDVSRKI